MDHSIIVNTFSHPRLQREHQTMLAMIRIYCRDKHGGGTTLCAECQALVDYSTLRLQRCRFAPEKPTCANCPVHCYLPDRREQVKEVMRYAGPRMMWRHPVLTIRHLIDGRKQPTTCGGGDR